MGGGSASSGTGGGASASHRAEERKEKRRQAESTRRFLQGAEKADLAFSTDPDNGKLLSPLEKNMDPSTKHLCADLLNEIGKCEMIRSTNSIEKGMNNAALFRGGGKFVKVVFAEAEADYHAGELPEDVEIWTSAGLIWPQRMGKIKCKGRKKNIAFLVYEDVDGLTAHACLQSIGKRAKPDAVEALSTELFRMAGEKLGEFQRKVGMHFPDASAGNLIVDSTGALHFVDSSSFRAPGVEDPQQTAKIRGETCAKKRAALRQSILKGDPTRFISTCTPTGGISGGMRTLQSSTVRKQQKEAFERAVAGISEEATTSRRTELLRLLFPTPGQETDPHQQAATFQPAPKLMGRPATRPMGNAKGTGPLLAFRSSQVPAIGASSGSGTGLGAQVFGKGSGSSMFKSGFFSQGGGIARKSISIFAQQPPAQGQAQLQVADRAAAAQQQGVGAVEVVNGDAVAEARTAAANDPSSGEFNAGVATDEVTLTGVGVGGGQEDQDPMDDRMSVVAQSRGASKDSMEVVSDAEVEQCSSSAALVAAASQPSSSIFGGVSSTTTHFARNLFGDPLRDGPLQGGSFLFPPNLSFPAGTGTQFQNLSAATVIAPAEEPQLQLNPALPPVIQSSPAGSPTIMNNTLNMIVVQGGDEQRETVRSLKRRNEVLEEESARVKEENGNLMAENMHFAKRLKQMEQKIAKVKGALEN